MDRGERLLDANRQPDGESSSLGLLRSQSVTEPTPNLAADIINLERDGGVSFIPRKDFRLQRAVPPEYAGPSALPHCESFTMGNPDQKMLYSPGAPGNYPNKSDCVVVLEAPLGFLVRLDFRDHFHIESSDDCKYDYLEVSVFVCCFQTNFYSPWP